MLSDGLPHILIADDDADDQFMLRRALEKGAIRYPIIAFNDGDDLLEFLDETREVPPCLLFLDLNMPRMTGFDVLAALKRRGLHAVRTVVVSGSGREEDIERARQLGAAEYLVKFPPPTRLAEVVGVIFKDYGADRSRCA